MFQRTGFSYVNCAFDPFSYRKHVLACWQWDRMPRGICYKKTAISFFDSEYPFLSLMVAKIRFLYVGNKITLLWALYHKKSIFAFSLLKHVGFSFIAQKTCFGLFSVILLFSVLLHQKKVFFQYAGSHPGFHLILLRQRFCFLLAKLRCLRIVFLRTSLLSISVTKLNFGRSFLLKNFLAYWQLNEVTLSHKSVSAFLCLKYAEFSFFAGEICFGLFAVKLGCFQRYCTGKCFLPVCSESLWFLLDFTQNKRFRLFSGKLPCFQDSCLEEQPLPFFFHKLRC